MPRVLASLHVETKMKNMQIIEKWPDIVGPKIAKHARATAADAENLFVEVDNPIWQSQLFLMKNKIMQRIKQYGVTIKDIKLCIKKKES